MSEEGLRYKSKRPMEVETVFGELKKNRIFNRFRMRRIRKVEVEFALLAMAHNLPKIMKKREKYCLSCIYTKYWTIVKKIKLERAA